MRGSTSRSLLFTLWIVQGSFLYNVNGLTIPKPVIHNFGLTSLSATAGADIEQEAEEKEAPQIVGDKIIYRGKVNEIDYCIAPGDVSLSRVSGKVLEGDDDTSPQTISLTQALNNASNRAVRRILLAKSWPSEEAFNTSLRLAAAAETKVRKATKSKCPVPRPILNLITRNNAGSAAKAAAASAPPAGAAPKKPRTNKEYVADQIAAFRERYGDLSGYNYAEAYLESILSLATTGNESPRVTEVLESKVYGQSYRRVISVLKSGGVVLEEMPDTERFQIAKKLHDQNICLSMMDTLQLNEPHNDVESVEKQDEEVIEVEEETNEAESSNKTEASTQGNKGRKRLLFWMRERKPEKEEEKEIEESPSVEEEPAAETDNTVILCSDEASMTRQLNAFSNIVRRVLLFGDDQELLILAETLADNDKSFIQRWYPDTGPPSEKMEDERRPGVQYLNSLILLLREAYKEGTVVDLNPFTTLSQSYSNSYERLVATLVEDGSGYIRPEQSSDDVLTMPKPRTPTEELGRFAAWESYFRKDDDNSHPFDLEGVWEVRDEVGGETIGVSEVTFLPKGEVSIAPPLQGLRWRLDPGPTHLDTCTFQALSEDGTVLQYRGFIDRGARLEARFSGRSIKIRGSVMFQMRYLGGSADYWKEMMPLNYMPGATKFEMKKKSKQ